MRGEPSTRGFLKSLAKHLAQYDCVAYEIEPQVFFKMVQPNL